MAYPASIGAVAGHGVASGQCDACRSKTMIRVLYFSDAHIEIRQSDESHPWSETRPLGVGPDLRPFVGTVDLLVLAGDRPATYRHFPMRNKPLPSSAAR